MNNNHDINLNIHYTAPDEVWEKYCFDDAIPKRK